MPADAVVAVLLETVRVVFVSELEAVENVLESVDVVNELAPYVKVPPLNVYDPEPDPSEGKRATNG